MLEEDKKTETGARLTDWEHSFLKKMLQYCSGKVLVHVNPSFYRSLRFAYPLEVGGFTRYD